MPSYDQFKRLSESPFNTYATDEVYTGPGRGIDTHPHEGPVKFTGESVGTMVFDNLTQEYVLVQDDEVDSNP